MPSALGYVAGVLAQAQERHWLRGMVTKVKSLTLRLEGQASGVYGPKQLLAEGV